MPDTAARDIPIPPGRLARRLQAPGPKRILSLDGGGARGLITVAFLKQIEAVLRQIHGRNDYVLADYFDLIGGTSVGSMLATMLALGWSTHRVEEVFRAACKDIFKGSFLRRGYLRPKFSDRALMHYLDVYVRDERLDSPNFETCLAIISKRVDTGSAWVVYNNPFSRYWPDTVEDGGNVTLGNNAYLVKDLIRCSTAAPTYFAPHSVQINKPSAASDGKGHFVDGGLSPYNDPSLLLFMMAGIRGYRMGGIETVATPRDGAPEDRGIPWKLGSENLLLISVGTGDYRVKLKTMRFNPAIRFGGQALLSLMADNQAHNLKLLQWLAKPSRPWTINSEVGDLRHDGLGELMSAQQSMLSFSRYNVKLEHDWLQENLNLSYTDKTLQRLRGLDYTRDLEAYELIGWKAAIQQVTRDDFPCRFNRPL